MYLMYYDDEAGVRIYTLQVRGWLCLLVTGHDGIV